MKAVVWHGRRDVRVERVPDPAIEEPTDAIVRVTSSGICGSDLHLYEVMGPFLDPGDVLGHEAMGVVEEVGAGVDQLRPGDRVVIPFNISCGSCFMCDRSLYAQCETTQVREHGKGAALFGYTKLYGQVPGGLAEYLDGDPLGSEDLATHRLPLEQAPHAYQMFQRKDDGAIKIVLEP